MRFWGSSKLDEIGWCWMHIQAWIWWQGILLQSQFSLFLCILKPEAYAQKLDRSKTPAQLHIMNWHPDQISIMLGWINYNQVGPGSKIVNWREALRHRRAPGAPGPRSRVWTKTWSWAAANPFVRLGDKGTCVPWRPEGVAEPELFDGNWWDLRQMNRDFFWWFHGDFMGVHEIFHGI